MHELVDYIAFLARLAPDRLAARDLTRQLAWSYAELDTLVAQMAGHLSALGVADGETGGRAGAQQRLAGRLASCLRAHRCDPGAVELAPEQA